MSKNFSAITAPIKQGEQEDTTQLPKRVRFPQTECGNAERFVSIHGDRLRYIHGQACWFVWNGTHWIEDERAEVMRLAKKTVRAMKADAIQYDDKILENYARTCESERALRAMVSLASHDERVALLTDDLDRNRWLLNVENGTLDLQSCRLRPHNPKDHLTHCLQVNYDPRAKCPGWG